VSRSLVIFDQSARDTTIRFDHAAHTRICHLEYFIGRFDRRSGQRQQSRQDRFGRQCQVLSIMSHESCPFQLWHWIIYFAGAAQQKYPESIIFVSIFRIEMLLCGARPSAGAE
jgi:hypothetical protein